MRLEHQLILSCTRLNSSAQNRDKIAHLIQEELDWELIIKLANYHGLTSLFYWNIKEFSSKVSLEVLDRLNFWFRRNACRNLSLTKELIQLIQNFGDRQIPVLAFKGPILAQIAYKNLGLREFIDLDVIVPESMVERASQYLIDRGYIPQFQFQGWQEKRYIRVRGESNFYCPKKDLTVDLHWSLIPKYFSFHKTPDVIWNNAQYRTQIKLADCLITTLSPEALLLFLCVHSSKHNWSHLCWVCDIAKLLDRSSDLNWEWINREVGNLGTQTMLDLGLWLAYDYFDAGIPDPIYGRIKENQRLGELAREIEYQWWEIAPEPPNPFLMGKIYIQTMENWGDRLWYWFDYLATPTPLEWEIIQLPEWLFFLYYPLRFMRLLWKYRPKFNLTRNNQARS